MKFNDTTKVQHPMSYNENTNLSNVPTNMGVQQYPDVAMIQSIQGIQMGIPNMYPQNMSMSNSPAFNSAPQYIYNSQSPGMRSPSPMPYHLVQAPPPQPQYLPQYTMPNTFANTSNNFYSTAPQNSTSKTQLSKNKSYVNFRNNNNHSSLNINTNSKISLSKLGNASRTNGLNI